MNDFTGNSEIPISPRGDDEQPRSPVLDPTMLGAGKAALVSDHRGGDTNEQNRAGAERVLREDIETYYFNRVADLQVGHLVRDEAWQVYRSGLAHAESQKGYKDVFAETALSLFDEELLRAGQTGPEAFSPLLDELASVLMSLDHNVGVYYSAEDVEDLFGVIAYKLFNKDTIRQLEEAGSGSEPTLSDLIDAKLGAISSLDHETALAITKDESGKWRVVDQGQYGQSEDFQPLEVLREDHADKMGAYKYRFRSPVYTRHQDDLHTRQVAGGWFTSEWYQEPNYWSAQLRTMLATAAREIGENLATTNTTVIFVTEGGIFKGTATADRDMDTQCTVACDSVAEFEQAHQTVEQALTVVAGGLPFRVKGGVTDGILTSYLDRSTGKCFFRKGAGEYVHSPTPTTDDGSVIHSVWQHETGVSVTTASEVILFRKPEAATNKEAVHVAISPNTGEVRQITEDVLEPLIPRPREAREGVEEFPEEFV